MFETTLFNEIFESKAPQKLLIVPAQLTLAAEEAAFEASKQDGFFDFAVMSGNKLRQEIVNKTGGPGLSQINSIGEKLILRKCIRDLDLKIFKDVSLSPEFLDSLADLMLQEKQNLNTPGNAKDKVEQNTMLYKKLEDLEKIDLAYKSYTQGKFMDSSDSLSFATSKIKDAEFIKSSEIWFEGFYSFNKEEGLFLEELRKNCLGLHINLVSPKEEFPKTLKKIYEAETKEDEALFVAAEILKAIREDDLSAEDILILSADFNKDSKVFKRVFESLNIPLYIDEKKNLVSINELEKVITLLSMAANGVRPADAMSFISDSDFSNYVKKYHIKSNMFFSPFKYGGEEKIPAEIKRDEFETLIKPFIDSMKEAKLAKEKCQALYLFLTEKMDLPGLLKTRAEDLFEEYPSISEQYSQCWNILVSILDQIVELIGDLSLSNEEFLDIIKSAFSDVNLGLLPQERGQITMGDLYRSKAYGAKALFITSFNDGNVPRKLGKETILSIDENEKLDALDLPLCKSSRKLSKEDYIVIYDAFANAKNYLCISYSVSDADGKEKESAYILKKEIEKVGLAEAEDIYTMESLIDRLRTFKETGNLPPENWQSFADLYEGNSRLSAAKEGLFYENYDLKLSKKNRTLINPQKLSASSLEKYARCPFAYFASYGLKAKEAEDFSLQRTDIGNIHHEVLDRLSSYLSADKLPPRDEKSRWQNISDKEIEYFVTKAVDDIASSDERGLLTKGNEEEYYISKVKVLAIRFAKQMVKQVRLGNIDKISTEQNFVFDFAGVQIVGKIDRVDLTNLSTKDLVKIVDYKTGAAKFDEDLIARGLSIQLMLYLEVATKDGAKPIGSFYFRVSDPQSELDIKALNLDTISDAALEKLARNYRLEGAFVSEEETVAALDKTAKVGGPSDVFNKNSGMSESQYETLRECFRTSLKAAIEKMKLGDISIAPKKLGQDLTSCTYCPYKMVCEFDIETEGFTYA